MSDIIIPVKASARNLGVIGYTLGFTLWAYKAPSLRDVFVPGHFDEVSDLLAQSDALFIIAPDGMRLCRVVRNNPDVVVEGV